jgi:hypothetical protein
MKVTQARTKINTSSDASLGVTTAEGEKPCQACQDVPLASRRFFARRTIAAFRAGSDGSSGAIFAVLGLAA